MLRKKGLAAKLVERSLFPRSVMVWGGICATGKTPLVFIERNVKINAAVYQNDILRGVVHPWVQEHFGENQFALQQDWAPAHGAKTIIQPRGAFSWLLGERYMAFKLTGFESVGLFCLVNLGAKSADPIRYIGGTESCIGAGLERNNRGTMRDHCGELS